MFISATLGGILDRAIEAEDKKHGDVLRLVLLLYLVLVYFFGNFFFGFSDSLILVLYTIYTLPSYYSPFHMDKHALIHTDTNTNDVRWTILNVKSIHVG